MNILIVDDNVATCRLIAAYLKRIDPLLEVGIAMTEVQALAQVEAGRFYCIIVEGCFGKGRANGLDLLTRLAKYQAEARFVVVGRNAKVLARAGEMGIPCLVKPIDLRKLREFLALATV